jgi:formylglycine-generating enzyme required for sulfatase activity
MKVQVCFVLNGMGSWLDIEPEFRLPTTEFPDDVMGVVLRVKVPEGMSGLRVLTTTEVWTFNLHPTYGLVPRLVDDAGEVTEVWPTNAELGGIWVAEHVLPSGNVLPMCYVEPAPVFVMGDAETQTRRKVNVPGGFMAWTPTTIRQWNWYCAANGKPLRDSARTDPKTGVLYDVLDHPVTEVSYPESCEFAQWAGVGLPTEEQWEHAARGNDGRKFPWGNEEPTDALCHSSIVTQKDRTSPVFDRPKGASPYGCLDMSGNVWEWTSTVHR